MRLKSHARPACCRHSGQSLEGQLFGSPAPDVLHCNAFGVFLHCTWQCHSYCLTCPVTAAVTASAVC
jgi:hypothetical protein